MKNIFFVDIEQDNQYISYSYPFLFQAYCAYDRLIPGSDNISSVALYVRKSTITIEFDESQLLCHKWYDYENDLVFADQDKLHLFLGKGYYKFIKNAIHYNTLPF